MAESNFIDNAEKIQNAFSFLIKDFGFERTINEFSNYGRKLEFCKDDLRVHLYYDFRDNTFNFYLIRGLNIMVPNDYDFENIKMFYYLSEKDDSRIEFDSLQPYEVGFNQALNNNVALLKKNGPAILTGAEWV